MAGQANIMQSLLGQKTTETPSNQGDSSVPASLPESQDLSSFAQALRTSSADSTNPQEGASFDPNAPFASEAQPHNISQKNSQTLSPREQFSLLSTSHEQATESLGLTSFSPSGTIFNAPEHNRQQGLSQLREKLGSTPTQHSPENEYLSSEDSFRQQADSLNIQSLQRKQKSLDRHASPTVTEQQRMARIRELENSLRQTQKQATAVSGAAQSLSLQTDQLNSGSNASTEQLRRKQLASRRDTEKRQKSIAHQIHSDRQSKKAKLRSQRMESFSHQEMSRVEDSRDENRMNELSGSFGE